MSLTPDFNLLTEMFLSWLAMAIVTYCVMFGTKLSKVYATHGKLQIPCRIKAGIDPHRSVLTVFVHLATILMNGRHPSYDLILSI